MSGLRSYLAGLTAEEIVARHYLQMGFEIVATRWKTKMGEIDLIVRRGPEHVFVEVKCAADHSRAAERVRMHQIDRIVATASQFLATLATGQDSPARFDIALVDRTGQVRLLENELVA